MGDQTQFSDDISALWGPSDTGVLEPAPLRKPEPQPQPGPRAEPVSNGSTNGAANGAGSSLDERLTALERQLHDLAGRVGRDRPGEGHLDALRTDLAVEVAQVRRDILAQLDLRLSESDARAQEHVREATGQVVVRLGLLDTDLHQAVDKVAAAMDAHEYEPVGKHRARTLRHELQQEFADQLAAVRTAAEQAVERRIAAAEAQFNRRLDALPDEVADAARDRVAQTEQQTARLAESIDAVRSQSGAALGEAVGTVRNELATTAERLAQTEQQTARLSDMITATRTELATTADRAQEADRQAAQLQETVEALNGEAVRRSELDDVEAALATRTEDRLRKALATMQDDLATLRESDKALESAVHDALAAVERRHTMEAEAHSNLLARLEQRLIQLTELVDTYRAEAVNGRELHKAKSELQAALADQIAAIRSERRTTSPEADPEPEPGPDSNGGRKRLWSRHHTGHGS